MFFIREEEYCLLARDRVRYVLSDARIYIRVLDCSHTAIPSVNWSNVVVTIVRALADPDLAH